jgi:excisionase family DNA binding protein
MNQNNPAVLTLEECRQILRISRGTLTRLIKDKQLKAFRVGDRWRVKRDDLLKFMENTE